MPYFIYHLKKNNLAQVKEANLLEQYEDYKQAKNFVREKRAELNLKDPSDIKIMFADNEEFAEKKLLENRDAPILREWEK